MMPLELRLRLAAVTCRLDAQQGKNGFRQHAGGIFTYPVYHYRKPQLVQQNSQQRGQVSLLARAVIARDHHRHRLRHRRRQAQGLRLHRFVETAHFGFAFALNTQGNQNAAHLQIRYLAVQHRGIERRAVS